MLSKNDKQFFALSFYRQSIQETLRAIEQEDFILTLRSINLANYWWEQYVERRVQSKNIY